MNISKTDNHWTKIIETDEKWYHLNLKELWHYKRLILLFIRRNFVVAYKQTILGYFWFVFPPIMGAFLSTFFYGNVISLPTDGLPPYLFYMSGSLMFGIFSTSFRSTSKIFIENASLYGKIYFPRLTVPIATLISNLINTAIQFMVFIVFIIIFVLKGADIKPNLWALTLPLLTVLAVGFGFGPGLISSVLTSRYRDLGSLLGYGITMITYISPLIYPFSEVPERYRFLFAANPITAIIETFRYGFLGTGVVNPLSLVYSFTIMSILMTVGLFMFKRAERVFLDTI